MVKLLSGVFSVPLAALVVEDTSAPRISSSVSPMAASLAGSSWTWTAGFDSPPMKTWATPGTCESFCTRKLSARSSSRGQRQGVGMDAEDHDRDVGRIGLAIDRGRRQVLRQAAGRRR